MSSASNYPSPPSSTSSPSPTSSSTFRRTDAVIWGLSYECHDSDLEKGATSQLSQNERLIRASWRPRRLLMIILFVLSLLAVPTTAVGADIISTTGDRKQGSIILVAGATVTTVLLSTGMALARRSLMEALTMTTLVWMVILPGGMEALIQGS